MKKSLYEISSEALEIASLLENDELTEELESKLVINQSELQVKAVNYAFVIKDSEFTVNAIDEEIKRLHVMKKREVNKQTRLKESVETAMKIYGFDKIETPVMKLSFRKSESVEIINSEQIPIDYLSEKITISENKTEIKKAIKAGINVAGAVLRINENLQIK